MFGLCESASSALMICIIVSIVLIVVAAIGGYGYEEDVDSAICSGLVMLALCVLISTMIIIWIQDGDKRKSLEDSLSKNYPGYTSLKSSYGDVDYSFVCNGQKYTCDFDYDNNKTLTVYVDNNKIIDGIYIDGQKQDEDNSKSTSTDEKQSSSLTSESVSKDNSTGSASLSGYTDNNSNSSSKGLSGYSDDNSSSSLSAYNGGGLVENIQSKILEKYSGAIITGFDMINYTGLFTYNNTQYSFSWKDDLLEVENAANANDVTYYKVTE